MCRSVTPVVPVGEWLSGWERHSSLDALPQTVVLRAAAAVLGSPITSADVGDGISDDV